MLDFLKSIFGEDITLADYSFASDTPYYIRDGYRTQVLCWNKQKCILLAPSSPWRIPTLKKQYKKIKTVSKDPCAFLLENLTALQRRNLIESGIPFISTTQQVFLPFWGCLFTEKFKAENPVNDKMAPGTQLVFLYLYYLPKDIRINLTQLSKELQLSKATCTRAINDLTTSGLINQEVDGTNKWISLSFDKPEFLKKGYGRLKSPVERLIYVNSDIGGIPSGIKALAELSIIAAGDRDGAIALSKKAGSKIDATRIISEQEFHDFGGYIIEVWCYDPELLSNEERVDDISLLLSLENDTNERIQMALDEIREKHELPIKIEE